MTLPLEKSRQLSKTMIGLALFVGIPDSQQHLRDGLV